MRFVALLCLAPTIFGCGGPHRRPLPPEGGIRPSSAFGRPLKNYTILSRFGPRDGRYHTGLDIRNKRGGGDPVYASRDGRVTRAQTMNGYGKLVEIKHGDGFSTRYAHLRRFQVKVGQ